MLPLINSPPRPEYIISSPKPTERNKSKMKQRNHSQLKDQEHSPERTNNEADLFNMIDTDFKQEIMKILKELRRGINGNTEYRKKKLETRKRNKEKLENSFAEIKAELKSMNSKMSNAEEQISDLE